MEKDLEVLKPYESNFRTAINSNYSKAIWQSDMNILIGIYYKWTNTKPSINMNCSKCKLDFIKRMGKLYFKKLEEYDEKRKIQANKEQSQQETWQLQTTNDEQSGKSTDRRESLSSSSNVGKGNKSKTDTKRKKS